MLFALAITAYIQYFKPIFSILLLCRVSVAASVKFKLRTYYNNHQQNLLSRVEVDWNRQA